MNTSKQVNVMIGLMFVFLVGTLLYFVWDTVRAEDAQERQIVVNAERGGKLFSLNCRSCHGINGLGPLENPNLPGIPLNMETNRPDDPGKLLERQSRILDTIRCGRVGTLMPAWAEDQGGPLNAFQILQLVTLITGAMPGEDAPADPNAVSQLGWESVVENANHTDLLAGKKLAEAASASATTLVLTDAQKLTIGSLLRIGEEVLKIVHAPVSSTLLKAVDPDQTELPVKDAGKGFKAEDIVQVGGEHMRVVSASGDLLRVERGVDGTEAGAHRIEAPVFEPVNEITVERAAFGTAAAEHKAGTQVFAGPIEPPKGPVTGADGTPPCGQLAPAAAPAPSAGATPVAVQGEVSMDVGDNFFQLSGQKNPTFSVKVGQAVKVNLTNKGVASHNMRVSGSDGNYNTADDGVSVPNIVPGGATATLQFTFDKAGAFKYQCDIHPNDMKGEIIVSQ
ncbi:MAG: cupredoxin domain-containing protein [Dehalococcoidia bacterium]|nr:cupredoxin domain-containing protein [Dehalococcoidia bacterium]